MAFVGQIQPLGSIERIVFAVEVYGIADAILCLKMYHISFSPYLVW